METHSVRLGRQHILEAAERLFTESGYRAVSIRDIAQACGVTNAALYYHFPDKEALFTEVMRQHAVRLSQRLAEAGQLAKDPRQRLAVMLREYMHVVREQHSPFFMLRREAAGLKHGHVGASFAQLMQAMLEPLQQVLAEAFEAGELHAQLDPYDAAAVLVGMLHGLAQRRRACRDHEPTISDIDVDRVVDIFWRGLAASQE
jgi:AcrR family transcriptional regulator